LWHVAIEAPEVSAQPIQLGIDADFPPHPNGIDIYVKSVFQGGLGQQLGIQPSETIELIDGQPIRSEAALRARLQAGPPMALHVRNPATGRVRIENVPAQGVAGGPNFGPVVAGGGGGVNSASQFRLTNEFLGTGRSLRTSRQGRLSMADSTQSASQRWQFFPVDGGQYRLVNVALGPDWSLTATPGSDFPTMEQTDENSLRQLWHVSPGRGNYVQILHKYRGENWALDNDVAGENDPILSRRGDNGGQMWGFSQLAAIGGTELAGSWDEYRTANDRPSGAQIVIDPDLSFVQEFPTGEVRRGTIRISGGRMTLTFADGAREFFQYAVGRDRIDFFRGNGAPETFYWRAIDMPPPAVAVVDLRPRLISKQVVAQQPLEPATVEFENTHDEELWVLVSDLRDERASLELKIPAGQSRTVQLDRDAGGMVVETWEVPLRSGEVVLERREEPIPAEQLYSVSVYELFVQSIALDATQKGRQKIEDINYSPKSVGAFPVPAGAALQDETLDVYKVAKRQKNPGGVRPIDPADWRVDTRPETDPIKRILKQHQQAR
jgi:hypothetical protein